MNAEAIGSGQALMHALPAGMGEHVLALAMREINYRPMMPKSNLQASVRRCGAGAEASPCGRRTRGRRSGRLVTPRLRRLARHLHARVPALRHSPAQRLSARASPQAPGSVHQAAAVGARTRAVRASPRRRERQPRAPEADPARTLNWARVRRRSQTWPSRSGWTSCRRSPRAAACTESTSASACPTAARSPWRCAGGSRRRLPPATIRFRVCRDTCGVRFC